MIFWLADNATFVLILLGGAAVALGFLWYQRRQRPLLYAIGGLGAAMVIVLLMSFFVDTDRKQLTRILEEIRTSLNDRNYDAAMKHVADTVNIGFEGGFVAKEKAKLHAAAQAQFKKGQNVTLIIWNVDMEKLEPPNAVVTCLFRLDGIEMPPFIAELTFTKNTQGVWQLTAFRVMKGLPGSKDKSVMTLPIP